MPQMDVSNYFSQVFWLITLFSSFYLLVEGQVLPGLHKTIKIRCKKLFLGKAFLSSMVQEKVSIFSNYSFFIMNVLDRSIFFLFTIYNKSNGWLVNKSKIKTSTFENSKNVNNDYLNSIKNYVSNKRIVLLNLLFFRVEETTLFFNIVIVTNKVESC